MAKAISKALLACVASFVPTAAAVAQPCVVQDPRVASPHVRWGAAFNVPINGQPWRLPWGSGAMDATGFWFDEGKNQYGFINGSIGADGAVSISAEVRNESRVDGDHFAVLIVLRDWQGGALASGTTQGGLNAQGVCKATGKGHSCWKFYREVLSTTLHPSMVTQIKSIEVSPGQYDAINDALFWEDVRNIVDCFYLSG